MLLCLDVTPLFVDFTVRLTVKPFLIRLVLMKKSVYFPYTRILFFLAILFYSAFSNGTVYCSDRFDMYNLWPRSLKARTTLVTEVCCDRRNSKAPDHSVTPSVLTLQINMNRGASIKIRNLSLGYTGQTEMVCDEKLAEKHKNEGCSIFRSIKEDRYVAAREYPGNPGLLLRVYDYDVNPETIKTSKGDQAFFMFSRISGKISVIGASEDNLLCQAKSDER